MTLPARLMAAEQHRRFVSMNDSDDENFEVPGCVWCARVVRVVRVRGGRWPRGGHRWVLDVCSR